MNVGQGHTNVVKTRHVEIQEAFSAVNAMMATLALDILALT